MTTVDRSKRCMCGCGGIAGPSGYTPGHEPELDHTEYEMEVAVEGKG